jgi:hypothetical protein
MFKPLFPSEDGVPTSSAFEVFYKDYCGIFFIVFLWGIIAIALEV